jgi:hypothetical protein
MRAGRELDRVIAQRVMGHVVTQQKREVFEATEKGTRPLANYTTDIQAAWEVAEKYAITLIPVQESSWFALVGRGERWASPADFLKFLGEGKFVNAGAAVGETAAMTICQAALKSIDNAEIAEHGAAGGDAIAGQDATAH